jgi:hypothetical protein
MSLNYEVRWCLHHHSLLTDYVASQLFVTDSSANWFSELACGLLVVMAMAPVQVLA